MYEMEDSRERRMSYCRQWLVSECMSDAVVLKVAFLDSVSQIRKVGRRIMKLRNVVAVKRTKQVYQRQAEVVLLRDCFEQAYCHSSTMQ